MKKKNYQKAQEMLDLLPEWSELDKNQLQARIFQAQNNLTEAAILLEQKLLRIINEVQMTILSLNEVSLEEGNDVKAEKLSNSFKEIVKHFELWDYNAYIAPLQIAVKKKNTEECILLFQSMLNCMAKARPLQNSILYNHLHKQENQPTETLQKKQNDFGTKMLSSILSDMENNPDYEFLRSKQEFIKLIQKYKGKCNKDIE